MSAASPLRTFVIRHRWLVAVPLTAAVALGLGAAGAGRTTEARAAAVPGEGLKIEVVQPSAPAVAPGPRMDVGELVDGYRHVAARPRTPDELASFEVAAWLEPLPPLPEPPARPRDRWERVSTAEVRPTAPQPSPRHPAEPANPYGFDRPAPDYVAERRARRERLAQIELERAEMAWRRPPPGWRYVGEPAPRPRLERDAAFY